MLTGVLERSLQRPMINDRTNTMPTYEDERKMYYFTDCISCIGETYIIEPDEVDNGPYLRSVLRCRVELFYTLNLTGYAYFSGESRLQRSNMTELK